MNPLRLRLVCNAGLEQALLSELRARGLAADSVGRGHCLLRASPLIALSLLRDLRCVTRVVWQLATGLPLDREGLLRALSELPWERWLPRQAPWAARATGRGGEIRHTHFAALLVKDAVSDRHRQLGIDPPPVSPGAPRVIVDLRVSPAGTDVGIDLGAASLHRRSGRDRGRAPLREDVAAGIARLAGAEEFDLIFDPFCGSGTLLAEACCARRSVGAGRPLGATAAALLPALREACGRLAGTDAPAAGEPAALRVVGRDRDEGRVAATARLLGSLPGGPLVADLEPGEVGAFDPGDLPRGRGLLLTNPPWGRRLSESTTDAWAALGRLSRSLRGWRLAVLCGDKDLSRHLRLRASRRHPLRVGGVDTRLLIYEIAGEAPAPSSGAKGAGRRSDAPPGRARGPEGGSPD